MVCRCHNTILSSTFSHETWHDNMLVKYWYDTHKFEQNMTRPGKPMKWHLTQDVLHHNPSIKCAETTLLKFGLWCLFSLYDIRQIIKFQLNLVVGLAGLSLSLRRGLSVCLSLHAAFWKCSDFLFFSRLKKKKKKRSLERRMLQLKNRDVYHSLVPLGLFSSNLTGSRGVYGMHWNARSGMKGKPLPLQAGVPKRIHA